MPSNRATLLALAERVEAATGPNFAIECEIAKAMGWWQSSEDPRYWGAPSQREAFRTVPPAFTSSLDTALTLVPKGNEWLRKDPRTMTVYRSPADDKAWAVHIDATGVSPALALCAAALRALAGQPRGEGGA